MTAHDLSYHFIPCCCFIPYCKSFTLYDIQVFDNANGGINWWNRQSNYLQIKRKVWILFVDIFKQHAYFKTKL